MGAKLTIEIQHSRHVFVLTLPDDYLTTVDVLILISLFWLKCHHWAFSVPLVCLNGGGGGGGQHTALFPIALIHSGMTVHVVFLSLPTSPPLPSSAEPSLSSCNCFAFCAHFYQPRLQTCHVKDPWRARKVCESLPHFPSGGWRARAVLLYCSPPPRRCVCFLQDNPGSSLRTTSPDPDLSQSVSDSQQHTVVADQRGGAHSRIKLHSITARIGGRIPPFPELQQLHRPGAVI